MSARPELRHRVSLFLASLALGVAFARLWSGHLASGVGQALAAGALFAWLLKHPERVTWMAAIAAGAGILAWMAAAAPGPGPAEACLVLGAGALAVLPMGRRSMLAATLAAMAGMVLVTLAGVAIASAALDAGWEIVRSTRMSSAAGVGYLSLGAAVVCEGYDLFMKRLEQPAGVGR